MSDQTKTKLDLHLHQWGGWGSPQKGTVENKTYYYQLRYCTHKGCKAGLHRFCDRNGNPAKTPIYYRERI
jgi:hypothetical protein